MFILDYKTFDDTLQNSQTTENADVFLLDASDRILSSAGDTQKYGSSLASEIQQSSPQKYFFSQTLACNNWKIAGFLPESDLYQVDHVLLNTQALIYVISLVLMILLLLYCNYSIIKR